MKVSEKLKYFEQFTTVDIAGLMMAFCACIGVSGDYFSNVLTRNQEHQLLLREIRKVSPDFIVLQEIDKRWAKSLDALKSKYPYHIIIPRSDNFGIALMSKYEFTQKKVYQNLQYEEMAEWLADKKGAQILLGDLNTTPWSHFLEALATKTNLHILRSFDDTWNSSFPIGFRIRLDHMLISNHIEGELEVLNPIGSDHLTLLGNFRFKE